MVHNHTTGDSRLIETTEMKMSSATRYKHEGLIATDVKGNLRCKKKKLSDNKHKLHKTLKPLGYLYLVRLKLLFSSDLASYNLLRFPRIGFDLWTRLLIVVRNWWIYLAGHWPRLTIGPLISLFAFKCFLIYQIIVNNFNQHANSEQKLRTRQ